MSKILRLRNDMKVETLYLSHGVVTIYLLPLSSWRNGTKLTNEDESHVDLRSISLCDLCIQLICGLAWLFWLI